MTDDVGPIEIVEMAQLTDALKEISAKGLPVSDEIAGDLLPNLKSIYARSVIPDDRMARISALNEQLPRWIDRVTDPKYREAIQTLFGLMPGFRGTNLKQRRTKMASILSMSVDHIRQEVEPDLLVAISAVIYDDLLRYRTRIKRPIWAEELTGDAPRLGPEHLTHQEELTSRIWQHVYGLRAEIIAESRLSEVQGYEVQVEDHRQAKFREETVLKNLITEYIDTYGEEMIRHGEAEYTSEVLERVSRWQL